MNPLLVFVGGGIGAMLRYAIGRAAVLLGWAPPLGTLAVNVAGCLAMGLLAGWFARGAGSDSARLFLLTGVLGGFTTFSAFGLDALTLWQRGAGGQAAVYVAASVLVSLAAVATGFALAR